MAKSLEDIINELIDENVSEKKSNELLDEYVKKQAAARTKGIQTKGGVFNPEFGGPVSMAEMVDVTPEEMDIARKSAKALEEYQTVNEPEAIKQVSKKTKTPAEKIRRIVTKSAVESGTPLKVDKFVKQKELEQTFKPVLEKEAIRENLRQRYASKLGSAAQKAEPVVEAVSDAEKYASIKPVVSPLEENIDALKKLPTDIKNKVLSSLLKGKTSAIDLLTKGAKIAAPIQTAIAGAEASKAGGELFGYDNLTTKQKMGKTAKLLGGSAMASVLPMEIISAGAATPVAIPTGLVGAGLYGLGEYLDDSGQPVVSPAPVVEEDKKEADKARTIDVLDKVSEKDLPQILEKNRPPVEEVKQYVIEQARERGEDPALALAQMAQESSFNPFAVSEEGAMGLGQHFPAAFDDAKKIDTKGTLKNLSYEEAMQPENWKAQVDAFFDYRNWLKQNRNPQNEEEFLKLYHAGSKGKYYNTPKNVEYFNEILRRKPRYEKELTGMNQLTEEEQELDRSPSSVAASPEEKADALRRLKAFLTSSSTNLGEENAPLSFGPVASGEEYNKFRQDQEKLMALKDKYEYLKGLKQTPFERPEPKFPTAEVPSDTITPSTELEGLERMAQTQTDFQDQLKQAQEQRKRDILIGQVGKSVMPIISGLYGIGSRSKVEVPEVSAFDEMIKQAGMQIAELKEKIAIEKDDPNSDASKMLRQLAEEDVFKATGKRVNFGNMSYNQLTEIYPNISRMAERLELAKIKGKEAAEKRSDKEEAKLTENQNKFLNTEASRITKSDTRKAYLLTDSAIKTIDDYIKDPTPAKSQGLKYLFPKLMDPQTGVKEGELRLLGLSGSAYSKAREYLYDIFSGKFSREKAEDFKNLIKSRHQVYSDQFRKEVGSIVQRGKRYNLKESETLKNVLGEEEYESFIEPAIKDFANKNFNGDVEKAKALLIERGDI